MPTPIMAAAKTRSSSLKNNEKVAFGAPKLINIHERIITADIARINKISEKEFLCSVICSMIAPPH